MLEIGIADKAKYAKQELDHHYEIVLLWHVKILPIKQWFAERLVLQRLCKKLFCMEKQPLTLLIQAPKQDDD